MIQNHRFSKIIKTAFYTLLLFLIHTNIVFAQVGSATIFLQEGALDKAKIDIDKACNNSKNISKAKTWFIRGEVYAKIASTDPKKPYFKLSKNAIQVAYKAYLKAIQLDIKKKNVLKDSKEGIKRLLSIAKFHAVNLYNQKDKSQALKDFKTGYKIDQTDTTVLINAAIISYEFNNTDEYIFFAKNYLDNDKVPYKNKIQHYINISLIYKEEKKDLASAIKIIEQAHQQDANNKTMYVLLGQLYDQNKEIDKSKRIRKEGYAKYPNDSDFNRDLEMKKEEKPSKN